MPYRLKLTAGLLATASLLAAPALAQEVPAAPASPHPEESEEIVITADYVSGLDLLSGTSVLSGDELARDVRTQLGDTLVRQPGVSATSFSPGASRASMMSRSGNMQMAPMAALQRVDDAHGLVLIEDAALAQGGAHDGSRSGCAGLAG